MDEHITRHLLHAIHQGWRNPGDLAAIGLAHLFEHCPVCREEFESWRRQAGEGVDRPEGGDFDAALGRVCGENGGLRDELESEAAQVESERRQARSRSEELLALPADDRIDWIRSESQGHGGPLLAEALIEESRRKAPGYPWEGITLANLARTVLQHSATTQYAAELYVRALAHLANAVRVTGDLLRSDQILSDARYFLRSQGGGDRLVRAELDSLEGSLRMGQRRPREAIPLLLRSQIVYRMDGDIQATAGVLVALSRAHRLATELDRSLSLVDEAEVLLTPTPQDACRLTRCILGARIAISAEKRDGTAAWRHLEALIAAPGPGPVAELRARWALAEVLKSLNEPEAAKGTWLEISQEFQDLGFQYDSALASLQAAGLAAYLGLPHDAEQLAADALPVFERLGVRVKSAEARQLRDRAAAGGKSVVTPD